MKTKNKFFLATVIVLLLVNIYSYVLPLFKTSEKNLEKVASEIALNSDKLVSSYLSNPKKSEALYSGKIIELEGFVKEVSFLNNRNTVILYTKNKDSCVICDVHSSQIEKIKTLKKHQKIHIKGICKGFLKDVILLNCYIDLKPNE